MGKLMGKLLIAGTGLVSVYSVMKIVAKRNMENKSIDDDNQYVKFIDKIDDCEGKGVGTYEGMIKPALDQALSFVGLVVLSPLFLLISLAVYIDDPGPVFFTQKRVGKRMTYFMCHKFRSMRMNTPCDVPTHQLADPSQYITRVGKVLRRTSLDELPQLWDIFRQRMSVVGPRPALWNQEDLVAYRNEYGANDVMPGLTGLAQIKGRDELLIPDKAALDGRYAVTLQIGGINAFVLDAKIFFKTVASVFHHDGVVEGGTGTMRKMEVPAVEDAGFKDYGCYKKFDIDKTARKRVLITGAGSYIGESFKEYCVRNYPNIECVTVDMMDSNWREFDFGMFDSVFHVAGIAHTDVGKVSEGEKARYYAINTDLAIETAKMAREAGCSQFIFMSSMIVYGGVERVDQHTVPKPSNFYGDSKWQADKGVRELAVPGKYEVAVLRPPMIYGRGAKGNYRMLAKLAKKMLVFPNIKNRRSMLYINNLCEFVGQLILSGTGGIFFPQNQEYVSTSRLVREIGITAGSPTYVCKFLNLAVSIARHMPGKIHNLVNKAFDSFYYDQVLSYYDGLDYQRADLRSSIIDTESKLFPAKENVF